jgi:CheY-like chemotaxis protein
MNNEFCILQVEDDKNDVLFLKYAFTSAGITHPLQVASDGPEAIDYLSGTGDFADRARYPLPCLVLLDLKMPGMTGLEVLEWIRAQPRLRMLPVIIFSSSAQQHEIDQAYHLGANSFVVKPACVEERNELARLIKGFWLRYNEPPSTCSEMSAGEAKIRYQASVG